LRRINWVAAGAFTFGGSLFALGAVVAQIGSGDAASAASIYLVGGIFFSTGAYASPRGDQRTTELRCRRRTCREALALVVI
jgi:hypothetical protein